MPIGNVNRIAFVNLHSISQFVTTRKPIADWPIFFHNTYQFRTFILGRKIADLHRLTDSAVLFHRPITAGKHLDSAVLGLW